MTAPAHGEAANGQDGITEQERAGRDGRAREECCRFQSRRACRAGYKLVRLTPLPSPSGSHWGLPGPLRALPDPPTPPDPVISKPGLVDWCYPALARGTALGGCLPNQLAIGWRDNYLAGPPSAFCWLVSLECTSTWPVGTQNLGANRSLAYIVALSRACSAPSSGVPAAGGWARLDWSREEWPSPGMVPRCQEMRIICC